MIGDEFVKLAKDDKLSSTNKSDDDKDDDKINPLEYFEFQATKKLDYIGWNNVLEKDFLAFSMYYSMKPDK